MYKFNKFFNASVFYNMLIKCQLFFINEIFFCEPKKLVMKIVYKKNKYKSKIAFNSILNKIKIFAK